MQQAKLRDDLLSRFPVKGSKKNETNAKLRREKTLLVLAWEERKRKPNWKHPPRRTGVHRAAKLGGLEQKRGKGQNHGNVGGTGV